MVDLHSHFLFGIDDGANHIEDSIQLLKQSVAQKVKVVIATPHINPNVFDNNLNTIKHVFEQVCERLVKEHIKITLGYAAEMRISPDILTLANTNSLPYLGEWEGNQVILLEFPHSHVPLGSDKLIAWLFKQNITPLIAHPERNRDAWHNPNVFDFFIHSGCLLQITAGSILGDFGSLSQKLAMRFINEFSGSVVIASDMHNLTKRAPKLAQAKHYLANKLLPEQLSYLFEETPSKIIMHNKTLITL